MPNALLTNVLIKGLYYYLKERIPTLDSLLEVTITSLHIPLTMEHSIRFILRTVQVSTKYCLIVRSGLSANTQVLGISGATTNSANTSERSFVVMYLFH